MSNANKSILFDLEISIEEMGNNPTLFAHGVFEAANKLSAVLDHTSSGGQAKTAAKDAAKMNRGAKVAMREVHEANFTQIYSDAEEMPLDELHYYIEEMRELTRQLELTFESRATTEMIQESPSAVDKKLAMEQYKKLRDAWEAYRTFAAMMFDEKLAPLKARSGNFGTSGVRQSYPAYKLNGAIYHNYRAVGRLIGCDLELKTHMDLQDYLTKTNNTEVEVVEITL